MRLPGQRHKRRGLEREVGALGGAHPRHPPLAGHQRLCGILRVRQQINLRLCPDRYARSRSSTCHSTSHRIKLLIPPPDGPRDTNPGMHVCCAINQPPAAHACRLRALHSGRCHGLHMQLSGQPGHIQAILVITCDVGTPGLGEGSSRTMRERAGVSLCLPPPAAAARFGGLSSQESAQRAPAAAPSPHAPCLPALGQHM